MKIRLQTNSNKTQEGQEGAWMDKTGTWVTQAHYA